MSYEFQISITKITIVLVIALFSVSCWNRKDSETIAAMQLADSIEAVRNRLPAESELEGYPIDYDSKVIETVYVIDRQGVDAMQEPNENSKKLFHYDYGDRLDVIETADDFYSIRDRVTRKWQDEHSTYEGSRWEKVFVRKSALGDISGIKLIPADLNVIGVLNENRNKDGEDYGEGKTLDKYLKVELVDKQTFEDQMNNKADYFTADTANVRKKEGVLTLKCAEKDVELVDEPTTEDDTHLEYDYQGQYEVLNQYVVFMRGYESWGYKFYDKITGKEQPTGLEFGDFPYLSPDKKHIICVGYDVYETTTGVELYKITDGNKVESIMIAGYPNWMPCKEQDNEWFWASDGCFYLKAAHAKAYTGDNSNCQYLRIKLL